MKNPNLILVAALTFMTAVFNFAMWQNVPTAPPMPVWIANYCADASPCTPSQVVNGIAFQQVALELDGSVCPDPTPPGDIWSSCVGEPSGAHWLLLTRGDTMHGQNAIDHDVIFASTLPIYGPGSPLGSDVSFRGFNMGLGTLVGFGMSPEAAMQAPQFPSADPIDTQTWFEAAYLECVANAVCVQGGGDPMIQPEFDGLLATSPYSAHFHPFNFTLAGTNTVNGVEVADATQVGGITGVPQ